MLTKGLHPDLIPYVVERNDLLLIQHPLVVMPLVDQNHNDLINSMYLTKSEKLTRAEKDGDWWRYIWLHERMFRAKTLLSNRKKIPAHRFWIIVGQVWTDMEIIYPDRATWLSIWRSTSRSRIQVMAADERSSLKSLDKKQIIFRGFAIEDVKRNKAKAVRGLSWTTNLEIAVKFSTRFATPTRPSWVTQAVIDRNNIRAYLLRRSEDEVIVIPSDLENIKTERV